jgi:signal recognition particle subunit SRP54
LGAEELAVRLKKNRFTLEDFRDQLEETRKLGPISQILDKIPGMAALRDKPEVDEKELDRTLAILRSMTLEERENPSIMGGSRKKRIAQGSGTKVRDVNRLLASFEETKKALKRVGGRRGKGRSPFGLLQKTDR